MKKGIAVIGLALIFLSACAVPKPYYETGVGKKKQKYYNDIQFGKDAHPKKKF
jgi:hypothetical protein